MYSAIITTALITLYDKSCATSGAICSAISFVFDFSIICCSIFSSIFVVFITIFVIGLYKISDIAIAIIPAHSPIPNFTNPFLYPKNIDNAIIAIIIISTIISFVV